MQWGGQATPPAATTPASLLGWWRARTVLPSQSAPPAARTCMGTTRSRCLRRRCRGWMGASAAEVVRPTLTPLTGRTRHPRRLRSSRPRSLPPAADGTTAATRECFTQHGEQRKTRAVAAVRRVMGRMATGAATGAAALWRTLGCRERLSLTGSTAAAATVATVAMPPPPTLRPRTGYWTVGSAAPAGTRLSTPSVGGRRRGGRPPTGRGAPPPRRRGRPCPMTVGTAAVAPTAVPRDRCGGRGGWSPAVGAAAIVTPSRRRAALRTIRWGASFGPSMRWAAPCTAPRHRVPRAAATVTATTAAAAVTAARRVCGQS